MTRPHAVLELADAYRTMGQSVRSAAIVRSCNRTHTAQEIQAAQELVLTELRERRVLAEAERILLDEWLRVALA